MKGDVTMLTDILRKYENLKLKALALESRGNNLGWTPAMVREARELLKKVKSLDEEIQKYLKDHDIQ